MTERARGAAGARGGAPRMPGVAHAWKVPTIEGAAGVGSRGAGGQKPPEEPPVGPMASGPGALGFFLRFFLPFPEGADGPAGEAPYSPSGAGLK